MPSSGTGPPAVIRVAFIGDIVGEPGREAVRDHLERLRDEEGADLVIANGENAAGGTGITPAIVDELLDRGVDVITSGNHIWNKKEIFDQLNQRTILIRPANYPPGAPGHGWCTIGFAGVTVGVLNLCGRIFMHPIDCPFRVGRAAVEELRKETPVIIVDMHAEATSEKQAMGWFLDGTVSAVIGTHTHVQTADARILTGGTAYITDAGMTGPTESVIGFRKEIIVQRFLSQLPMKFEVARRHPRMEGVVVSIDTSTGSALSIRSFGYSSVS
jgi:metallophosphoesterase (TIGR00282 family)